MSKWRWLAHALIVFHLVCSPAGAQKVNITEGIITTVAGNGTFGSAGDGGLAIAAQIIGCGGIAVDHAGNLYVDGGTRRVGTDGVIATATKSVAACGIAVVDSSGNIYIAQLFQIIKIDPSGGVTTPFQQVAVYGVTGMALDGADNLYVSSVNAVRKVSIDGTVSIVAGTGKSGFSGDGGPAVNAQVSAGALAFDSAGSLYIADGSSRVRRVDQSGTITTVAGNGTSGFSGDGGTAISAQISDPQALAVDSEGNLYIADRGSPGAGSTVLRVRRVSPDGTIYTIAGNGSSGFSGDGGPAMSAQLGSPLLQNVGLAVDAAGNLYIAEASNRRVRKITPTRVTALTFRMIAGGSNPPPQMVEIHTADASNLNWTADVSPGFLSITSASGATPGTLVVSASGTRLPPSNFGDLITIRSSSGSVLAALPVTLVVERSIPVVAAPSSLQFYALEGTNPPPQTVQISTAAGATLNWLALAQTGAGCTAGLSSVAVLYSCWLLLAPGSLTGIAPGSATVLIHSAGLPPGQYFGTITVQAAQSWLSNVTVSVVLTVQAFPKIKSVVNWSSGTAPASPGAIISVVGSGLVNGNPAAASGLPLPTSLAGASVLVNGTAMPLVSASAGRINAQLPLDLPPSSTVAIQVVTQAGPPFGLLTSDAFTASLDSVSPGILTLDQNGSGPGVIVRASDSKLICPSGRRDCSAASVLPGQSVVIYMSGLGAVNGSWTSGQVPTSAISVTASPVVAIGGILAPVSSAVLAGGVSDPALAQVLGVSSSACCVGIYKVTVQIPSNAPRSDHATLIASVAGRISNQVTISIAPPPGGGPFGGVVWMAVDPGNSSVVYATGSSGRYKSIDQGASWFYLGPGGFLAVDPVNSGTVYGLVGSGFARSNDGGQTWTRLGDPGQTALLSLVIDPLNANIMYALGYAGLTKSTDGGISWNSIYTPGLPVFAMDPTNSSTIYLAAGPSGLIKSVDGGQTWADSSGNLRTALSKLDPTYDTYVPPAISFMVIDPTGTAYLVAEQRFLFSTADGGQTWVEVTTEFGDQHSLLRLTFDPTTPSTLYAFGATLSPQGGLGSPELSKSTDGGKTWVSANSGIFFSSLDFDGPILTVDPSSPSTVYFGSYSKVLKTTDGAQSWQLANAGIPSLSIGTLGALAIDSNSTLYSAYSTVFTSADGGASWVGSASAPGAITALVTPASGPAGTAYAVSEISGLVGTTDGGISWTSKSSQFNSVQSLAVDPTNAGTLYVTGAQGLPQSLQYGLYKSTDDGLTWGILAAGPNMSCPSGVNSILIDSADPNTLYAGLFNTCTDGGIFKSTDGGQNWGPLNAFPDPGDRTKRDSVAALAIDPVHTEILYAKGSRTGVFRSADGGQSWTALNINASVANVIIDPITTTHYALTSAGVYKSLDGGQRWTGFPADLSGRIVFDPKHAGTLYAGRSGVFKSTDGGLTWEPTSSNVAKFPAVLQATNLIDPTRNPVFQVGDSWSLNLDGAPALTQIFLRGRENGVDLGTSGPFGTPTDTQGHWSASGGFDQSFVGGWQIQAIFGSPSGLAGPVLNFSVQAKLP